MNLCELWQGCVNKLRTYIYT